MISSEPFQKLVETQEKLTTAIENILFDQIGDLDELVPQFRSLFGQNIRSLIAYVTGNPLAAGSEYPDEGKSIFTSLADWIWSLVSSSSENSEEVSKLQKEVSDLKSKLKSETARVNLCKLLIKVDRDYYCDKASQRGGGTDIQITICNHMRRVYSDISRV